MTGEYVEIYVYLMNEGTDCWRPTTAESLGGGRYRVLATQGYDSEDEEREFPPGTVVRCERKTSGDGREGLVAKRVGEI